MWGFVGEFLFVFFLNGVNEDDGWLLMLMYDVVEYWLDIVILDVCDLNKKFVVRLYLKYYIFYGLYGSFIFNYF